MKEVTAVLPVRNGRRQLWKCLKALEAGTYKPEVIVVDDGSDDGTVQMVKKYWPSATLLSIPAHTGYAHAANAGLRLVRTEYAFLICPDLQPGRDCTAELLEALRSGGGTAPQKDGRVFCAVPLFLNSSADSRGSGKRKAAAGIAGKAREILAVRDGCAMYRMDVLEEIGWFDERHFDGLEAFDLSLRAALYGYRTVQAPAAAVRLSDPGKTGSPARSGNSERSENPDNPGKTGSPARSGNPARSDNPGKTGSPARSGDPSGSGNAKKPKGRGDSGKSRGFGNSGTFRRQLAAGNAVYTFYKNMPPVQRVLGMPVFLIARAAQVGSFLSHGEAAEYRMAVERGRALCSLEQERRMALDEGISVYPENLSDASFLGMDEAAGKIFPLYLAEKDFFDPALIPRYLHIQKLLIRDLRGIIRLLQ